MSYRSSAIDSGINQLGIELCIYGAPRTLCMARATTLVFGLHICSTKLSTTVTQCLMPPACSCDNGVHGLLITLVRCHAAFNLLFTSDMLGLTLTLLTWL